MKKLFLFLTFTFLYSYSLHAANPYSQFGVEGKEILTEQEKYGENIVILEAMDTNELAQKIIFDFHNMQAQVLDKNGNLLKNYDISLTVPKRWFSRDPKASSFTGWSPYNSMLNNPISVIDPGGDSAFAFTDDPTPMVDDLNAGSQALSYSSTRVNGTQFYKITATFNPNFCGPVTPADQTLYDMTVDPKNNINLFSITGVTTYENESGISQGIDPAAFGGKFVSTKGTNEALVFIDYEQVDLYKKNSLVTDGEVTSHEMIEAYLYTNPNYGINTIIDAHNQTHKILNPSIDLITNSRSDPSNPNITIFEAWNASTPAIKIITQRKDVTKSTYSGFKNNLIIQAINNRP